MKKSYVLLIPLLCAALFSSAFNYRRCNASPRLEPLQDLNKNDATVKHTHTINEFIKKNHFNGIIIFNGEELSLTSPILSRQISDSLFKDVTFFSKAPVDSIIKYGVNARFGLLIFNSK